MMSRCSVSPNGHYLVLDRAKSNALLPVPLDMQNTDSCSIIKKALKDSVFSETNNELFFSSHGTCVALENIYSHWFKSLNAKSIATELENHFEALIRDGWLEIIVSQHVKVGGKAKKTVVKCDRFDSSAYAVSNFKDSIEVLSSKKKPMKIKYNISVGKSPVPNHTPVRFFRKGRRISHVVQTRSFLVESEFKESLWGSPLISGFIEFPNEIEPVVTRDEFVKSADRDIVYKVLISLEQTLMSELESIIESVSSDSLNDLEVSLESILDSLFVKDKKLKKSEKEDIIENQIIIEKEPEKIEEEGIRIKIINSI